MMGCQEMLFTALEILTKDSGLYSGYSSIVVQEDNTSEFYIPRENSNSLLVQLTVPVDQVELTDLHVDNLTCSCFL